MLTFMDSCFFVTLLNNHDEKHVDAKKTLNLLKNSQYGALVTTDYIVDEVLTTIWATLIEKTSLLMHRTLFLENLILFNLRRFLVNISDFLGKNGNK